MSNQGYQEKHANSLLASPLKKTYVSKLTSLYPCPLVSLTSAALHPCVVMAMAQLPIACPRNVLLTNERQFCIFFIASRLLGERKC